ncbi:MAG: nucleotide exchange factor GrpE [Deltaproteobacteria bacterium]|jgi:molecular chaperone GrpE|nr:nucleotide exchange factor GrpE [Deltaproteobacteria bacterium]
MTKGKTKVDELRDALKKKGAAKEHVKVQKTDKSKGAETQSSEFEKQMRAAEEDAKQHYDKLLKVMAEFENFKKRMAKEKDGLVRFGNDRLLADLLPSLDDLDRVLDHVPPDAGSDVKKFAEGVELVRKSLLATLGKYNLKEVPAIGQVFDPSMHEAIGMVESEEHGPNEVIEVHRKGYWLADRLLRPTMVTVCKG